MARKGTTPVHLSRCQSGTLEIAPDDGSDLVVVPIVDGVADVPDELVDHVLRSDKAAHLDSGD